MKQIKTIESMQQQSESVKNQYFANIKNLDGVVAQQDDLMCDLSLIETELDAKLAQYENDPEVQRGLQSFGQQIGYQEVPLRDKVLQNTQIIDQEIGELRTKLGETN